MSGDGELRGRRVRVNEVFSSIQGEARSAGEPCTFIRSQGCNLRCAWCDTAWALPPDTPEAQSVTPQELLGRVRREGWKLVCLTGGEPLLQAALPTLVALLLGDGRAVELQTNGTLDLAPIKGHWPEVRVVMDVKCPGSGMAAVGAAQRLANLRLLDPRDDLIFVLATAQDFDWACEFIAAHPSQARPAFSAAGEGLSAREVGERILSARLDVRLNLQHHKRLWDPSRRGV